MSYVQRIKEARINAGMTQEQLAKAVGVAKSTITSYEKGNREISAGMIQRIAQATGSSVEFIFQDEEKERQPANSGELSKEAERMIKLLRAVPENQKELAVDLVESVLLALIKHAPIPAKKQAAAPAGSSR